MVGLVQLCAFCTPYYINMTWLRMVEIPTNKFLYLANIVPFDDTCYPETLLH